MKLTGKFEDEVSKAEKMEESKNNTVDIACSLTDEELEDVAGGAPRRVEEADTSVFTCPVCQVKTKGLRNLYDYLYSNHFTCPACRTSFAIERTSMQDKISDILERIQQGS